MDWLVHTAPDRWVIEVRDSLTEELVDLVMGPEAMGTEILALKQHGPPTNFHFAGSF